MKTNKLIYWISTGLLCLLMLFSAGMYLFNHDMIIQAFTSLGFPTYIIYPLAIAKILAVIAILSRKSTFLKEWAYAGIFFDVILAFSAHIMAGDGAWMAALVGIVLVVVSRFFDGRAFGNKAY